MEVFKRLLSLSVKGPDILKNYLLHFKFIVRNIQSSNLLSRGVLCKCQFRPPSSQYSVPLCSGWFPVKDRIVAVTSALMDLLLLSVLLVLAWCSLKLFLLLDASTLSLVLSPWWMTFCHCAVHLVILGCLLGSEVYYLHGHSSFLWTGTCMVCLFPFHFQHMSLYLRWVSYSWHIVKDFCILSDNLWLLVCSDFFFKSPFLRSQLF